LDHDRGFPIHYLHAFFNSFAGVSEAAVGRCCHTPKPVCLNWRCLYIQRSLVNVPVACRGRNCIDAQHLLDALDHARSELNQNVDLRILLLTEIENRTQNLRMTKFARMSSSKVNAQGEGVVR
jgi:hypothetical protein